MVYLPTLMVDFYGFHVGKYTSPMDPMGKGVLGCPGTEARINGDRINGLFHLLINGFFVGVC